jgi:Ser/Thr protein kinase RdoA (MazF antagonist)
MIPAETDDILDAWRLPRPRAVVRAEGGYQNTTLLVSSAAGEFVLRVHTNVADPAHQRFEHELLRKLAAADLPFAVPRPLPSDDGETLRVVGGRLAALFARIPGDPLPKDGGPALRQAAAAALARLDIALERLEGFETRPPTFDGDLLHVHPLVDDLGEAVDASGLDAARRDDLRGALERTLELAAPLYASSTADHARRLRLRQHPRPVWRGHRLLDFEHSGIDVRAMDLAVALYRFPAHEDALGQSELFGRAYSSVLALDPAEVLALPALLNVRAGVSLVHWVGRMRAGFANIDDIRPRAGRALFTAEWVAQNGKELVRRGLGWIGERV